MRDTSAGGLKAVKDCDFAGQQRPAPQADIADVAFKKAVVCPGAATHGPIGRHTHRAELVPCESEKHAVAVKPPYMTVACPRDVNPAPDIFCRNRRRHAMVRTVP